MKSLGLNFGRVGIRAFVRSAWKFRHFALLPTVVVEFIKGHSRYAIWEVEFLCFGIGLYFSWRKH